ncbi:hypothetical protein C8R45DRAFT_965886 [Mycena sanguinolenta]|nr:hypothetical protein C8R45DRAFT_965886 [Mycena sanguinolenta]
MSLPNLEFYDGDAGLILAIDSSGLKGVKLTWFDDADTEKIILGVSSMIKPNFPLVISHKYMGDHRRNHLFRQIVTFTSKNIQHTRSLRFRSFDTVFDPELSDDTALHIMECLPRFTSLVYLSLEWIGYSAPSRVSNADRIVIEAWGKACPTLEGCGLYFHGWRKLDGRWEECPMKEFLVLAGFS